MHDATSVRNICVQAGVQVPGSRIGSVRLLQCSPVVRIEEQQLVGGDLREVSPAGIHQKTAAIARNGDTEMICDRFRHSQPREPAEGGGEIGALLLVFVWPAYRCHIPPRHVFR